MNKVSVICDGQVVNSHCNKCGQRIVATGKKHYREYVPAFEYMPPTLSALFVGYAGRLDEDQVLLEIESRGSYHAYQLNKPELKLEIKTIGPLWTVKPEDTQPPSWFLEQFPNRWWRRIR